VWTPDRHVDNDNNRAPVAWLTSQPRTNLVRGGAGLSVAPTPRSPVPPLAAARQRFGDGFYQIYFPQPGVAGPELIKDVPYHLPQDPCGRW
jgi:hypothetical protein